MQLIEKNLIGKTGKPEECEDFLVFTKDFAAIIDGVTGKTESMKGTGRIAGKILKKSIENILPDISMEECLNQLTNSIYDFYLEQGIEKEASKDPRVRIAASAIIYCHSRREIWMMGDCHCMVNGKYYDNPTSIDSITGNARALFNHLQMISGVSYQDLQKNDLGRDFIKPLLQRQSFLQNNPEAGEHAFFIIDGFAPLTEMVKVIKVPPKAEIILASDGYPKLFPSLHESEDYLQTVIKDDPLLISIHPSTKGIQSGNVSFDDRAFLKFKT